MALGSVLWPLWQNKWSQIFVRTFGTPDYHGHFRLAPIFSYLESGPRTPVSIAEIGCGRGEALIECCIRVPVHRAVGLDIDTEAIAQARRSKSRLLPSSNAQFEVMDVEQLRLEEDFDVIILADILEHVEDHRALVEFVYRHLSRNGVLLISVPTPLFPRVFGRDFHESIGHLRDGYRASEVAAIFDELIVVKELYSTGPLVAPFCALFYRFVRRVRHERLRKSLELLLIPTAILDLWRPPALSCSMFMAMRRPSWAQER